MKVRYKKSPYRIEVLSDGMLLMFGWAEAKTCGVCSAPMAVLSKGLDDKGKVIGMLMDWVDENRLTVGKEKDGECVCRECEEAGEPENNVERVMRMKAGLVRVAEHLEAREKFEKRLKK